jgi:hypothetical protein
MLYGSSVCFGEEKQNGDFWGGLIDMIWVQDTDFAGCPYFAPPPPSVFACHIVRSETYQILVFLNGLSKGIAMLLMKIERKKKSDLIYLQRYSSYVVYFYVNNKCL